MIFDLEGTFLLFAVRIFIFVCIFFIRQLKLKFIPKISGLGSMEVAQTIWDGRTADTGRYREAPPLKTQLDRVKTILVTINLVIS